MEHVVEAVVDWQWLDICVYKLLTQSRGAEIQTVLDTDMLDPASQRYALGHAWPRWRWGGEGRACNTAVNRPLDVSQLYSFLGGWYEREEPGTTSNETVAVGHQSRLLSFTMRADRSRSAPNSR